MQIAKNTVVSLTYELFDTDGKLIEKTDGPIDYLHGGYQGIFPLVEQALAGKTAGEACRVRLEPDDGFGDYDAQLVHLEPRNKFPDNIAEDKVVVDGNHPLAGKTLDFTGTVTFVRAATAEELAHGHVHGAHGHEHHH